MALQAGGVKLILIIVAIILFVLAAFGVAAPVGLLALGLAFFAGAFLF